MTLDEITASLWAAVAAGLLILIPVVFRVLPKLIEAISNAWIDKLQDDRTRIRVALAKEEIKTAFEIIGQTLVPEIRAAASDGKITDEEKRNLRQTALTEAKRRFGAGFWTDLMKRLGLPTTDVDTWILGQLEAYVFQSKDGESPPANGQATAPGPAEPPAGGAGGAGGS